MSYPDYFSRLARIYSLARPTYPDRLFKFLSNQCIKHDLAWDCATGNGQAALGLVKYFKQIIATDASKEQIQFSIPHDKIIYQVEEAENTTIQSASINLVTVGQALHWFNIERFYEEVRRVTANQGIIAVFAYPLLQTDNPAIQESLSYFYHQTMGPYWPAERSHCDNRYQTIPFPFKRITAPDFRLEVTWNLSEFLAYLSSWSSVQRYKELNNADPIGTLLKEALSKIWGNPALERVFSAKLILKVGYVHS